MRYDRNVLFFELFPAFVMLVGAVIVVRLYIANRRARGEPEAPPPLLPQGRTVGDPTSSIPPTGLRSSMRP
jgi:hypothetical protein